MELTLEGDWVTPTQLRDGRWYKRDDLLRYSNGVNGKVRTALFLADVAANNGALGLVYGGSVLAPALGRVAAAAAYSGLECKLVIGSNLETARRHPTVAVAEDAGATFIRSSVAYNPALQRRVAEFANSSGAAYWPIPYGVSHPMYWDRDEVWDFLGADLGQTAWLVEEGVRTLVVPFGSANAALSILHDLALNGWGDLRKIVLVGVGPDKRQWLWERCRFLGITARLMTMCEYLPLHPHFAEYADKMPEHRDGIDFHPTYEGKVVRYLDLVKPEWWTARDGSTCMWIVGGPLP